MGISYAAVAKSYARQAFEIENGTRPRGRVLSDPLPPPMASSYPFPNCGGAAILRRAPSSARGHLVLRFPSSLVRRRCGGSGAPCFRRTGKSLPCRSFAGDSAVGSSCGLAEGNGISGEEEEDELDGAQLEDDAMESSISPERWDVLGLGQAMVDFSGMVDDEFLARVEIEKGTRKVVNHEERGRVLRAMDGCSYKAAAGGSLSNTLVALSRLGRQSIGGPDLNVAMAGSVGGDPLGGFYRAKLRRANVNFLSPAVREGTTGTVIVLTTPDAQRTMLAYQGTSSTVLFDSSLANLICKTNVLVVEGYLFELPDTAKTIVKACELARENGALVAVTASDVSCIKRCYDNFWEIIGGHADILFANATEAQALCDLPPSSQVAYATRYLSHFVPLVSVTDGPQGSYMGLQGEAIYIPPTPCTPVDTTGAGDAYAAGVLYAVLRGSSDLKSMGLLASRVASVVVAQQGTRLRVSDARNLAESFAHSFECSGVGSDFGSDLTAF